MIIFNYITTEAFQQGTLVMPKNIPDQLSYDSKRILITITYNKLNLHHLFITVLSNNMIHYTSNPFMALTI